MLKLLMISPWFPWPPHDGARIRILETLRYLGARHEVTFLAHVQSDEESAAVGEIERLCAGVHVVRLSGSAPGRLTRVSLGLPRGRSFIESIHFSRSLADTIFELTARVPYDVVHIEFSFLAHYTKAIHRSSRAKRVLSTHNIESQRFAREIELSAWGFRKLMLLGDAWLFPKWEQRALAYVDAATAVSAQDRAWIVEARPEVPTRLTPNGVDTEYFSARETEPADPPSLVFTGVMDYPPNVDAVTWFVEAVWPELKGRHPKLEFLVVGAKPSESVRSLAAVDGVRVTGAVDDIRPYVRDARAFVVPLRSGGGTRLKILQALSMACPVVSSRLGAEGLEVDNDRHLIYADRAEEFVGAVDRLLTDADTSRRLGRAGRALVVENYDWARCLSALDGLYAELLEQP